MDADEYIHLYCRSDSCRDRNPYALCGFYGPDEATLDGPQCPTCLVRQDDRCPRCGDEA